MVNSNSFITKLNSDSILLLSLCPNSIVHITMSLLHDNIPSENILRYRLQNLDLDHDVAIEEAIVEESDDSLAMGGKRGSKRGPQLCGKVNLILESCLFSTISCTNESLMRFKTSGLDFFIKPVFFWWVVVPTAAKRTCLPICNEKAKTSLRIQRERNQRHSNPDYRRFVR